ncbi:MAG TPA: SAM-dependent chlorinase/fluorinase [Candidatus Acidoferrales bacterium]|nr:SAM-dependent chlorinase/fluorinase [Candidatus Acidoferrales bacterium]
MSLVVLLTDFGVRDYFVGVMKGVIAKINPDVKVVDLTHEIEPQNVRQAAFALWACRKFFPTDSIFVNVVDPGVGSSRRIICGRIDGQIFVAPDNGLLDYVVSEAREIDLYEVTNKNFFLVSKGSTSLDVSSTFHGRDIFAPTAAYISRGTKLDELGKLFDYRRVAPFYTNIKKGDNAGEVVYRDGFGNVFTSFLWDDSLLNGTSSLRINSRIVSKFVRTYSEGVSSQDREEQEKTKVSTRHKHGSGKELICVKGSSGLVEIAINLGDAAKILKSEIGQKVVLISK